MKKGLFVILAILLMAYIGVSWLFSEMILRSESTTETSLARIETTWPKIFESAMKSLPEAEEFSIEGLDEVNLEGKFFAKNDSSDCAIILAHGWTDSWLGMLKYVPVLEDCPCHLAFYDHRAHGSSGGEYGTGGVKEAADLLRVTDWLEQKTGLSSERIGWVGSSWGAAAALTAGADEKKMAFIIADAPFQDWETVIFDRANILYGSWVKFLAPAVMNTVAWRAGIDYKAASAINAVKKTEEPILLIHSQMDQFTASSHSIHISKHLQHPKSEFRLLDWGGDHNRDVIENKAKFHAMMNAFLGKLEGGFLLETNPSILVED